MDFIPKLIEQMDKWLCQAMNRLSDLKLWEALDLIVGPLTWPCLILECFVDDDNRIMLG